MTTVFLAGVFGKMGRQVARMMAGEKDLTIVGGLAPEAKDKVAFPVFTSLAAINVSADVWVDFTLPQAARANAEYALNHGMNAVIGTSGLSADDQEALGVIAQGNEQSLLIVPNFAISAVLMMQFAAKAAKYFPDAEVVEAHHSDKLDAPSGTAKATAKLISEARTKKPVAPHQGAPARGEWLDDVPVHALRLPGYVAQEEVVFGAAGESLSIKQVSFDRSSFMAGVALAARQVDTLPVGLTVGLDALL
ncbi:4-hydroxy-tetrahydrodipicolinate reductase [Lacticaseibacillus camelliae]|uniref:4-hydroxy-tetrahydrodipicolinate reductase n=1 Tax=Lacticaseibacillus camelliae DSM 22697 = JCM 13995 TaxID=1423730 RepID=A0A0R2F568_9LACO|nr:4-hydroxy-tetrahydrodipicolinate reductase [Lacticaseibacillus camelliae]KRN21461.1 dihydrodipicolinate reductase [Lacticaseibacillus camelliae DSM 22697 = JCM 13995]